MSVIFSEAIELHDLLVECFHNDSGAFSDFQNFPINQKCEVLTDGYFPHIHPLNFVVGWDRLELGFSEEF